MKKYYLAERLKNRHTSTEKLMLLMPCITVYLSAWLTAEYFTIDVYNWWYTVLFPGMISSVCGAVGNRDKKMGNRAVWTLPADMGAVWDGKVLYGIRCMGASLIVLFGAILLVSTVFEQVVKMVFRINPTGLEQLLAIVVLFLTSLWQIPFCLLLHQMIGLFPMVLLHVGSIFLISVTMSLKPYFMLLPGGIAGRMMCIILKILPNGLPAEPGSITFTPELLEWKGVPIGILVSLVWFAVFWFVSRKWFERRGGGGEMSMETNAWKELCGNIKGELQKMRRTLLPWLHAAIPMLGILVFLGYYSFAAWNDEGKILGYIQVLTIVLPMVVSVICSISVEMEEKGHFQTFLGVSVCKSNPLLAKWMTLSGMGFLSILLAVLGFAAGYWAMKGRTVLLIREYLLLALVMWLCSVNLYLIHLLLNLAFSKIVSLCMGITELLVAALFLTGLGDGRWQFLPCSWGSRWTEYLIQYWMGNGAAPKGAVMKNLEIGTGVTFGLWFVVFLWFYFYEGKQCRD